MKKPAPVYRHIEAETVTEKPEPMPFTPTRKHKRADDPYARWAVYKQVRVEEDWYPNYADGTVQARIGRACRVEKGVLLGDGWRVSVWGLDDYGLEKFFPDEGFDEAAQTYNSIGHGITKAALLQMGFK